MQFLRVNFVDENIVLQCQKGCRVAGKTAQQFRVLVAQE